MAKPQQSLLVSYSAHMPPTYSARILGKMSIRSRSNVRANRSWPGNVLPWESNYPSLYMERHWALRLFAARPGHDVGFQNQSIYLRLIPPLFFVSRVSACAACVTATDPVFGISSVVGKGKFAKRVPKHLRDVLDAESGCNDGMAFPLIYIALGIIKYGNNANEVALYPGFATLFYMNVLLVLCMVSLLDILPVI